MSVKGGIRKIPYSFLTKNKKGLLPWFIYHKLIIAHYLFDGKLFESSFIMVSPILFFGTTKTLFC